MAKKEVTGEANTARGNDMSAMAGLLEDVKSIAESARKGRKVPLHEATIVTAYNPTGAKRKKLGFKVFQNGVQINEAFLHDEELELLRKLKPGRYNGRRWEVLRRRDDGAIDIRYSNKDFKDRFDLVRQAGSLKGMLQIMVDEYENVKARKAAGTYDPDEDY